MSHFQVATLTKQQKDIVDEILSHFPADTLIYHTNVEIPTDRSEMVANSSHGKRKSKTQRLLVVSKFRLFLLVKDKSLEKDYPILFLTEIAGQGNTVSFRFSPPKSSPGELIIRTDEPFELVHFVRQCYRQFTFGWPEEALCAVSYSNIIPFVDEFDPGPAHGFIQTYLAFCNAACSLPRNDLIAYITDLYEEGIADLDLTSCPGIDPKSEQPLDLISLAHALKYNTYFKGLEIRDVENKDAAQAIAIILTTNRTLTRIVCVNCSSEIPDTLGTSLSQNPSHTLQIIQLSGNKFTTKSIESFCKSLPLFTHELKVLDLSNTGLVGTASTQLLSALNSNTSVSMKIQQLNISNSNPAAEASTEFNTFVSNIREKGNLTRLSLANTGSLITGSSLLSLGFSKIKYLDISDNKFAKMTLNTLFQFCEITRTLEVLRLANTGLTSDVLGELLKLLANNHSLGVISVDLARNNIGPLGISHLVPALKRAKFDTLDLTENNIKDKGGVEMLKNIKYVKRLLLDKNAFESEHMASTLGLTASSHPELYSLSISGNKFGRSLKPFAVELQSNSSIEELDISSNACGDSVFFEFCSAIRLNAIKVLKCDGNSISYSGYLALRNAIASKPKFSYLQFPIIDFEQDQRHKQKFMEVLVDIITNKRLHQKKYNTVRNNLFEFDMRWQTPGNPRSLRRIQSNSTDNIRYPSSEEDGINQRSKGPPKKGKFHRSKFRRKSGKETTSTPISRQGSNEEMNSSGSEPKTRRELKRRYSESESKVDEKKKADREEIMKKQKSEKIIPHTIEKTNTTSTKSTTKKHLKRDSAPAIRIPANEIIDHGLPKESPTEKKSLERKMRSSIDPKMDAGESSPRPRTTSNNRRHLVEAIPKKYDSSPLILGSPRKLSTRRHPLPINTENSNHQHT